MHALIQKRGLMSTVDRKIALVTWYILSHHGTTPHVSVASDENDPRKEFFARIVITESL
jgi:hypothetical protein